MKSHNGKAWIGVDLDGTLAYYTGWQGPEEIGAPIPRMLERVKIWLEQGVDVRIFTARACIPEQIPFVEAWVLHHLGVKLPVTNAKDMSMLELWDDRCIRVQANTGERCCDVNT